MRRLAAILMLLLGMAGLANAQQQVQPVAGVLTLNLVPGVNSFKVILAANVTSTVITNPTPGTIISVIFTENATGGFTVAFGGNISNPCTVTTTANATTSCQFQYDATANTWNGISGGGGITSAVGPVINVTNPAYSGCPATSDWTTCFTSVAAASNGAAFVNQGGIAFKTGCITAQTAVTSVTCNTFSNGTISAGDTVLVGVADNNAGRTITITDSGGNTYIPLKSEFNTGGAGFMTYFGSNPGVQFAANSITVSTSGGAQFLTVTVADYTGVGGYGLRNVSTTGSSTAPSFANTTEDANNYMVSVVDWFSGANDALSASIGSVRTNVAATATLLGMAIIDNTAASALTSVTTSGTLAVTAPWAITTVELRSGKPSIPTVYFPVGTYNYAGGLNLLFPTTLSGEGDGSRLCYTGAAHAVDFGPTNLTTNNYQFDPYTVQTLYFTCGDNMTEGIYVNNLADKVNIRHNTFLNFGNPNSYSVFFNGETDDALVEFNYWWDWDGIKRNVLSTVGAVGSISTQLRFIGNVVDCVNGKAFAGACTSAQAGVGVATAGASSLIAENNFNFFCPDVLISSTWTGYNTRVINNYMEGANPCNALIEFNTEDGIHIEQNFLLMNHINFPIAPISGTDLAINMLVAHNYMIVMPAATELVNLNNLTTQTGNLAFANMCSTAVGAASTPCPKTHTAGGNITQWNSDYSPPLTFSASTTASYTFVTTYSVAPKCTIPPNIPGTATTLTITTLSTTTLTITASASNSSTVSAICNPDAQ